MRIYFGLLQCRAFAGGADANTNCEWSFFDADVATEAMCLAEHQILAGAASQITWLVSVQEPSLIGMLA